MQKVKLAHLLLHLWKIWVYVAVYSKKYSSSESSSLTSLSFRFLISLGGGEGRAGDGGFSTTCQLRENSWPPHSQEESTMSDIYVIYAHINTLHGI